MRTCQQISLQISKVLEFWKTLIRRIKPYPKKTPSRLALFAKLLISLLNCWMVFFFSCEKILVPDVFFYSHSCFFFLFIPNISAICKNKICFSTEPKMISKKLENSHLSSFSLNLTDISKIIAKYCRNVISKYRQKSLFVAYRKPTIMFIIFWNFWCLTKFSFKFFIVVRYFILKL